MKKPVKTSKFSPGMGQQIRATWRTEFAYWIVLKVLMPLLKWEGMQLSPQDSLKHAPMCMANRWNGAQKVTFTCTCGAVYWSYHDKIMAAQPSHYLITYHSGSLQVIDRAPDGYEIREAKKIEAFMFLPLRKHS